MAIVTPFVQVGTYPTRNFATYRGFDPELALHQLTFRHRAGVTPYTSIHHLGRVLCFY